VAGLRAFLRKDFDNLITVDVVCHGVPSAKLFDVYLKSLQGPEDKAVEEFKFRDKSKYGWGVYWSYKIGKKHKTGGLHDNPYIAAFIDSKANRECCYQCKYTGVSNRPGDITLADYWGIDVVHPEMASNDGVSAVIVNSEKAMDLSQKALNKCIWTESSTDKVAKYNPSLVKSAKRPVSRDHIYEGINILSEKDFVKRNLSIPIKKIVKTKVRLMLPYNLRTMIKALKNKH
jgi:hypothetical protein